MQIGLIITVVSDDKPGIVDTLAQTVSRCQGSWLESNFSHLAGKFAGVFCVQVDAKQRAPLEAQLEALQAKGIHLHIEQRAKLHHKLPQHAQFSLLGPDKKGIVKEVSQTFLANGINIESMETQVSSAPYSGEPIFQARGTLSLPQGGDFDKLEQALMHIADQLGVDVSLHPQE